MASSAKFLFALFIVAALHFTLNAETDKVTNNDKINLESIKPIIETYFSEPQTKTDQKTRKAGPVEDALIIQKPYNVLAVTMCLRGHLNPAAATVRALTDKGHKVSVIALDSCQELVRKSMPNIADYHEMVLSHDIKASSNPIEVIPIMDEGFRVNLTIKLFSQLDNFISKSSKKFDVIFGDNLLTGVVLAGKKYNIPVATQHIGPLFPTARTQKPFLESSDLARENPNERPSLMSVIGSALFDGLMEVVVTYPLYNTLKQIHNEQGWEDPSFDYGKFPFSYIHRHSVLLSHGAPPISKKRDQHYQNVQSIGFVPDDVMYPPLTIELSDWLEKADGPVVFISLGTITVTSKEESKLLFEQLTFQDKFYFIWAVKKPVLIDLDISEPPFISKRLFLGQYLPQGKILQHPKVRIFVTHCGANSMLDSVNGVKPMITYPGFADQPIISNTLITEGVANLLKQFTYLEVEPILDEMLSEPNYSEMVARLQLIKNEQFKIGGYKQAVEVIEQMAEGKILINRTMVSEDVFGIPLYDVIAVCGCLLASVIFALLGIILCFCRLSRQCRGTTSDIKKMKLAKQD